jgi:hypothetical protein
VASSAAQTQEFALAEIREVIDAFGTARVEARISQTGRSDPPALTMDKINKALMLGRQVLSFLETHSNTGFHPLAPQVPRLVAELQTAASEYRDIAKGLSRGGRREEVMRLNMLRKGKAKGKDKG